MRLIHFKPFINDLATGRRANMQVTPNFFQVVKTRDCARGGREAGPEKFGDVQICTTLWGLLMYYPG